MVSMKHFDQLFLPAIRFFAAACSALWLSAGCGPAEKNPPPMPVDFEVRWGGGSPHSEWGQEESTLTAQGDVIQVKSEGFGKKAKCGQTRGHVTRQQQESLWKLLHEQHFFKLQANYTDFRKIQGFTEFITIRANGRTNTVSVTDTAPESFAQILAALDQLRDAALAGQPTVTRKP